MPCVALYILYAFTCLMHFKELPVLFLRISHFRINLYINNYCYWILMMCYWFMCICVGAFFCRLTMLWECMQRSLCHLACPRCHGPEACQIQIANENTWDTKARQKERMEKRSAIDQRSCCWKWARPEGSKRLCVVHDGRIEKGCLLRGQLEKNL